MLRVRTRQGFTLIELLVVVAIIALLISILLPGLGAAREQGKKAKCLANLRSIGAATHMYASEFEFLIPIHEQMRRSTSYWEWRIVHWFAWGGRSATEVLQTDQGFMRLADTGTYARPVYSAQRRPLNIYSLSEINEKDKASMELYRCPSDRGYPEHPSIDDAPQQSLGKPCYDILGNSYRASLSMLTYHSGGTSVGHFSFSAWGKRISTLKNQSDMILLGEPTFFNMIGMDNTGQQAPNPVLVMGWHKRPLIDNVLFCDGSARPTRASKRAPFDFMTYQQMQVRIRTT